MIFYIDIDNTICLTKDLDYEKSKPIKERIKLINALFDKGHDIIYWTARGSADWRTDEDVEEIEELTLSQLKSWGCKFNQLILGKPIFDYFIDDKAFNSNDFFNEYNSNTF